MARTGIPTGSGEVVNPDSGDGDDGGSVDEGESGVDLDTGFGGGGGGGGGRRRTDLDDDGGGSGGEDDSSGDGDGGGGGIATDVTEDVEDLESGQDAGDGDESPPGAGEEVTETTDPDTGDARPDRLRDDAESDPMNTQTETVGGGRGGDLSSAEVERIRREAELSQRVREAGSGGRAENVDTGQIQRDILAERVREATPGPNEEPTDVDVLQIGGGPEPGDVRVEPGYQPPVESSESPVLGQGLEEQPPGQGENVFVIDDPRPNRDEFRGTRREIAQLIEGLVLEEQRSLDEEDIAVVATDDGLAVRQTFTGVQKRWLANQMARDVGRSFRSDAITTSRVGAIGAITEGIEEQVGIQRPGFISGGDRPGDIRVEPSVVRETDLQLGEDFNIAPTFGQPGQFTTELTDTRRRLEAERQFEARLASEGRPVDLEAERDIELGESGTARLSEEGERTVATADTGALQSDIPIDTLRIVSPSQFGAAAASRREGEVPLPVGLPGTEVRIPLGQDAETLAYDVGQQFESEVVDPAAEAVGDIGQVTFTSPAAAGSAVRRGEIPVPILPPTAPSVQAGIPEDLSTFAEAEVRGAGALVNPGAMAKSTIDVLEYGQAGLEAAADTGLESETGSVELVQGPGPRRRTERVTSVDTGLAEFGRETSDVAVEAVEAGVEFAQEEPIEFSGRAAGSLVASGLIMGGAGALSRGAGLTARLAIQPGEEIAGIGGFRATRAIAGERTAQRLFPMQEPLIFSEEAAIRGVRRAGGAASRGAGRARSRLSSEVARTNVNVGTRPGALFGGLEFEVERSEAEEETLGPELDPFDYSDTRIYDPTRTFGETEGIGQTTDPTQAELPQDIGPGIGGRGEAGGFRGGTVEENFQAYLRETRGRGEAAQRSFLESEEVRRPRVESALDTSPLAMEGLGFESMAGFRAGEILVDDTRSEVRSETGLRSSQEFETEPFMELRSDLEFETEAEWESEFELEFETELELETEFELELEDELELEVDRDEDIDRDRDDLILPKAFGFARIQRRELINPFTGE